MTGKFNTINLYARTKSATKPTVTDISPYEGRAAVKRHICSNCGYVYDPAVGDPDNGVPPGTAFENIPDDWVCPLCGAGKEEFEAAD